MTIETKFNVGDTVFFIYDDKCLEAQIIHISIFADDNHPSIKYHITCGHLNLCVSEYQIYYTKEELLKSMRNKDN